MRVVATTLLYVCFLFTLTLVSSCGLNRNTDEKSVTLFAASGTMAGLAEVCDSFEQQQSIRVNRNFSPSGLLARQIVGGAEADVFVSANWEWMETLRKEGVLIDTSIRVLANTQLVVVTPAGKRLQFEFTPAFDIRSTISDKIAIGDPAYVPAGEYAMGVLDSLGWLPSIGNRIVLCKDVSTVVSYVELGECDWGIVYLPEALKSNRVAISAAVPGYLHKPVNFYIALLKSCSPDALKLHAYLLSPSARRTLQAKGFDMPVCLKNR